MPQHDGLTRERWAAFPVAQQVLMIANEMHRAGKLTAPEDGERQHMSDERVLRLTDLTIATQTHRSFRRELLRFRDLAARFYVEPGVPAGERRELLRHLLLLTVESARQRAPLGLT